MSARAIPVRRVALTCDALPPRPSQLARRHVKVCSSLKGLKGYLEQASSMKSLPSRPVPQYSVELLDL